MEFKEIYRYLSTGNKVRRREWRDKTIYLWMDEAFKIKCYRQECAVFLYDLTILDDDWFIVGEEEAVSFANAIPALLQGKKVKLKDWPSDCFVEADGSKRCLLKRANCEYDFIPTFDCFSANDWELIEEDLIK